VSGKEEVRNALAQTEELISSQTNVKKIAVTAAFAQAKKTLKPDFSKLGPAFGKKATSIIAKLVTMPAVSEKIEKDGKATIVVDSEKFELTRDHFAIESSLPQNWVSADFTNGSVYVNAETNKELEAEGFARELMRKTQTMRKEAGLQKSDAIVLFVKADAASEKELVSFKKMIEERCGAKEMRFAGEGSHKATEKIKDKEIVLSFDVVKKK
jgi:isoleucyl-tRNA synthetase